jgi:hypothetical protein
LQDRFVEGSEPLGLGGKGRQSIDTDRLIVANLRHAALPCFEVIQGPVRKNESVIETGTGKVHFDGDFCVMAADLQTIRTGVKGERRPIVSR